MSLYSALARPVLFALDAERVHDLTIAALGTSVAPAVLSLTAPADAARLHQQTLGLTFRNPIGLAAGLDKQGTAVRAWEAVGFGFAELGTITPRPQPGNPKPRLFRLRRDRGIINRFGFNSEGAQAVATNLSRTRSRPDVNASRRPAFRVGINVGKNKDTPNEEAIADYLSTVDVLHPFADYFVINVSSPNTVGLRALQDAEALRPLVRQVVDRVGEVGGRPIPVLVKVSPDMSGDQLLASVDAAVAGGASGIVATNTTISRAGLTTSNRITHETGGLSGAPLRLRARDVCRTLFRHLRGRVPIIGVGGIFTAEDAFERITAGASLVQVYTALVYGGPSLVSRIAAGLQERLDRDGLRTISDAVGIDAH